MYVLIYTPEDGPRQQWDVNLKAMPFVEAELIEEAGGSTWDNFEDFEVRLVSGNSKAKLALLWVLLRRENPKLRFVDLGGLRVGEVELEWDRKRLEDVRAEVLADESISESVRTERLAEVDERLARIGVDTPVGKDEPDDSPTDSPSPPPDSEPSPNSSDGTSPHSMAPATGSTDTEV